MKFCAILAALLLTACSSTPSVDSGNTPYPIDGQRYLSPAVSEIAATEGEMTLPKTIEDLPRYRGDFHNIERFILIDIDGPTFVAYEIDDYSSITSSLLRKYSTTSGGAYLSISFSPTMLIRTVARDWFRVDSPGEGLARFVPSDLKEAVANAGRHEIARGNVVKGIGH
jgi:hypothetical protein